MFLMSQMSSILTAGAEECGKAVCFYHRIQNVRTEFHQAKIKEAYWRSQSDRWEGRSRDSI